jgi:hypothetical protein
MQKQKYKQKHWVEQPKLNMSKVRIKGVVKI